MKLSYRIVGDTRLRKPGGAQLGEHARPERGIEARPKDIDGACSRLISGYQLLCPTEQSRADQELRQHTAGGHRHTPSGTGLTQPCSSGILVAFIR